MLSSVNTSWRVKIKDLDIILSVVTVDEVSRSYMNMTKKISEERYDHKFDVRMSTDECDWLVVNILSEQWDTVYNFCMEVWRGC